MQNGSTLHAQLEVWKAARCENNGNTTTTTTTGYHMMDMMDTMDNNAAAANVSTTAMPWSPAEPECPSVQDEFSDGKWFG